MSGIEDFAHQIHSVIDTANQTATAADGVKSNGEELATNLESLDSEAAAAQVREALGRIEEAQTLLAQAIEKLNEAATTAQSAKGLTGEPSASPAAARVNADSGPNPLAAAPTRVREPIAKIGDPLEPGPQPADPYRQELAGADDTDATRNRFARSGRVLARNIGDLQEQARDSTAAAILDRRQIDPHKGATNPTVEAPPPPQNPIFHALHIDLGDIVTIPIVLTAVAFEIFSRRVRKRRTQ